jgi:hypothetical protein
MDQRVGMNQFDAHGEIRDGRFFPSQGPVGSHHEEGADPLARAENGVAHGLGDHRIDVSQLFFKKRLQRPVEGCPQVRHPGQRVPHGVT